MKKSQPCPLADPEIGVVSENDHKVGLCLCHFCKCGKHICPARPRKKSLPYRSNYRCQFVAKAFDSPIKMPQKEYRPNDPKMDLTTVNRNDFRGYSVKPSRKEMSYNMAQTLGMPNRSAYCADFPDWGAPAVCHEKEWHPPVVQLPFKADSSYRLSYKKGRRHKDTLNPILFAADKNNVKFGSYELNLESTYAGDMRGSSIDRLNYKVLPKKSDHSQAPCLLYTSDAADE